MSIDKQGDGAAINGPAFTQPGGPLQFRVQMPDEDCDYRYTNFVEVIAPLILACG